jgi:hypothetical protein
MAEMTLQDVDHEMISELISDVAEIKRMIGELHAALAPMLPMAAMLGKGGKMPLPPGFPPGVIPGT